MGGGGRGGGAGVQDSNLRYVLDTEKDGSTVLRRRESKLFNLVKKERERTHYRNRRGDVTWDLAGAMAFVGSKLVVCLPLRYF